MTEKAEIEKGLFIEVDTGGSYDNHSRIHDLSVHQLEWIVVEGGDLMRFGICGPMGYDPARADADYLEPTVSDFLLPSLSQDDYRYERERMKPLNRPVLSVNYLFPPEIKTIGPGMNARKLDEYVEMVLGRAEIEGVNFVVYGSGPSRTIPAGFPREKAREQVIGNLARWGTIAKRHSVTIVLEHLNRGECNLVTSVAEAAEIAGEVNNASVRIVVDTYHMEMEREHPSIIRESAKFIAHVHTAEADGRNPVGTCEDHRPYFRALKDIGYSGCISIEAKWKSIQDQAPKAVRDLRHQYTTA